MTVDINAIRNKIAQKRANEVTTMVNDGQGPALRFGIGKHLAHAMAIYGVNSFLDLMGKGFKEEDDGRQINLGKKKSGIDCELRSEFLQFKKHLHAATLQAHLIRQKTGMPCDIKDTPYFRANISGLLKAYNVTDFNDWIPTLNTRFYFEELEIIPGLSSLFPDWNMTSTIQNVPLVSGLLKGKLETDTATFSAQSETDGKVVLTAKGNVAHVEITEDLIQDSDPGVFERLRRQVAMALARSRDDALINGDDTGGGHMDSDVTAGTDFRKAWKGLRKLALDNFANGGYNHAGARPNLTLFTEVFNKLKKAREDRGDLIWICGLSTEGDTIGGRIPELLTIQNAGGNATLFSGQMPPVLGISPFVSQWVREDLNSSGVYAAASSLTTLLCVKKSRFVFGTKSPMRIWASPSLPSSDLMLMTAKERIAFGGAPQGATETSVCIARNIATL